MRKLLIGLLGVLVAASPLAAATNFVAGPHQSAARHRRQRAMIAAEKEYKKLLEADDAAQAEVDQWIRENDEAAAKGAGVPSADLKRRIRRALRAHPRGLR